MYDEIIKDVLSFAFKLFPVCMFPLCVSSFIRFIKDCCLDRRMYNRSWHVTRQIDEKPHVPSDCEKWVKEFEDREGISIYG